MINKRSKTRKCFLSNGKCVTVEQRDEEISIAKLVKLNNILDVYGYVFCEDCKKNKSVGHIDMSHTISVKEATETRQTELCWDLDNLRLLCRQCHNKHDNNGLRKSS